MKKVLGYRLPIGIIGSCIKAMKLYSRSRGGFRAWDITPYARALIGTNYRNRYSDNQIADKLINILIQRERKRGNIIQIEMQSICARRRAEGKTNSRCWRWVKK